MRRTVPIAALAAATAAVVAGCTGSGNTGEVSPGQPRPHLTVWSAATEADHLAAARHVVRDFTAATGIEVELVPAENADLEALTRRSGRGGPSGDTSGDVSATSTPARMPDVIGGLPLPDAHALAAAGLIDTDAVARALDDLDRQTFQQPALRPAAHKGLDVAVPSDASAGLLVYRRDLFAKHDLPAPDTFEKLETAARTLETAHRAGIALPTAPDELPMIRTFEHLALADGCHLLDDSGDISLETPECVDAFAFYSTLASYDPADHRDAHAVRVAYLAGHAAIMPASSAFLDDLGGIGADDASATTCTKCEDDPTYLAKHSGVVTAIRGPDAARPVRYGTIRGWTITSTADTDAARRFVSYMMSRGYLDWLGASPGGFPMRLGTVDEPEKYAQAWSTLPKGRDEISLSSIYPPTLLDLVRASAQNFRRWGHRGGDATLVAALHRELPVAHVLAKVTTGSMTPEEAAAKTRQRVMTLRDRLHPSPATTSSP